MTRIINDLVRRLGTFSFNVAFKFESEEYLYSDLIKRLTVITNLLDKKDYDSESVIGFDASEVSNFETYCQILSCIISGKCFVPINLDYPQERVEYMLNVTGIKTILINSKTNLKSFLKEMNEIKIINTNNLETINSDYIKIKDRPDSDLAYILFTSGSTGTPKGVPLTRKNLLGFIENFNRLNYQINQDDKFLQMFDFTFDLSIFSYLIPLFYGASICPISSRGIKLSNTFNTLLDENISVALVVPSLLSFLKPYYEEISLPSLRYLFFCGEALSNELTFEFSKCVPHARIVNFYGPTEATIFCTYYEWKQELMNIKHHNGSVSIGKAFPNMLTVILDEQNKVITQPNIIGELCLAGNQLTPGYYKNDEKNKTSFVELIIDGNNHRLYRTGDLAFYDKDGDIMFVGRKDFQIKIQGYRIELGEIEYTLRKLLNNPDVVVVSRNNKNDITELHAFIKGIELNKAELKAKVSEVLPAYMLPTDYHFIKDFPLNNNGKIDRNKLKEIRE